MKPLRVWILGLTGLVAASCVGLYWLKRPTFHAASLAFTLMWTALLIGLLELRSSHRKAFWFGFVVFGWGYALLAFAPGAGQEIRPYLFTSHLLGDLSDLLDHPKEAEAPGSFDPYTILRHQTGIKAWFYSVDGERFQRVGHSIVAVLHGVAGGFVAVLMDRRRRRILGREEGRV